MYKFTISTVMLLSSIGANAAPVEIIDTEFQGYNYNGAINYFSPVGQSFTAGANQLDFIDVLMLDLGTAVDNHQSYLLLREGDINGGVIGQSQTVQLEDCFNFIEAPGCGIGGGTATEVRFDFSGLSLIDGNTYTFQIMNLETSNNLGFGYDNNGGYSGGTAFINGAESISDLWFRAGHISAVPVPAAVWLFASGLIGLAGVARRKK